MKKKEEKVIKQIKIKRNFHIAGVFSLVICLIGLICLCLWAGSPMKYNNNFLSFMLISMSYLIIIFFTFIQFAEMMGWLEYWEEKLK